MREAVVGGRGGQACGTVGGGSGGRSGLWEGGGKGEEVRTVASCVHFVTDIGLTFLRANTPKGLGEGEGRMVEPEVGTVTDLKVKKR